MRTLSRTSIWDDPDNAERGLIRSVGSRNACAVFALIAARPLVAAMRTCADNIPVGKKSLIRVGVHLPRGAYFEMSITPKHPGEMLSQFAILYARRTTRRNPRQVQNARRSISEFRAVLTAISTSTAWASLERRKFRRCAVLVGRANEKRPLFHAGLLKTGIDVCRQHGTSEICRDA